MADKFVTAAVMVAVTVLLFLLARAGNASTTVVVSIMIGAAAAFGTWIGLTRPHSVADVITGVALGLFVSTLALASLGLKRNESGPTTVTVTVSSNSVAGGHDKLFVLVHGFEGGSKT